MKILFASKEWKKFKSPLRQAFKELKLNPDQITSDLRTNPEAIEFVIYAPDSVLQNFSSYKNLKAILSLWAGVDSIIRNNTIQIPVYRLIDSGMTQGMVEWCTSHVLRHHLSIDRFIKDKKFNWNSEILPPLSKDRTVGILGVGTLGSAVGKALYNLGFNVHGWSRTKKKLENIKCYNGASGLNEVLSISDILILLLPLTKKTEYIINDRTIGKLRSGVILINPGRGPLIDDKALLKALDSGKISHATLDVFCVEPLPDDNPYWYHDKVTVTPHIASGTRPESASKVIASNIKKIRAGLSPPGLVKFKEMY